ncbi:hypothetical protein J3R82DRAFT_5756 [Butyriboletus roseoflavus]|nr:hypothetical protein J3R82DRAFT_5756 [Butyriboletus roseoflavus]
MYGTMLLNPCSSAALQIPCSAWSNPLRILNKTPQARSRSALNSLPFVSDLTSSDLWERLCFKSYPLLAEQLARNVDEQPESWRDQYFLLREAEAHRLEEVASRLRNQRMEAAERKKEREVKLTDKLPPTRRARTTWGTSNQPKSLFQKTKSEATKLRRSLYAPRLAPQTHHSKVHRLTTASPLAASSTKPVNSRITVKTVSVSRPSVSTPQTTSRPVQSMNSADPASQKGHLSPQPPSPARIPSQATDPRPSKPPIQKKDPMATLFMPKHRALSQLPSQAGNNSRSVPAR